MRRWFQGECIDLVPLFREMNFFGKLMIFHGRAVDCLCHRRGFFLKFSNVRVKKSLHYLPNRTEHIFQLKHTKLIVNAY